MWKIVEENARILLRTVSKKHRTTLDVKYMYKQWSNHINITTRHCK